MISKGIMNAVLMDPARAGGNRLRIVSGYASPAMLENHLRRLSRASLPVDIWLTIGMSKGSLDSQDRRSYQDILRTDWKGPTVSGVSVISKGPQVHSKIYVWSGPQGFKQAFAGSANYSVSALVEETTKEVCAEVNWEFADEYVRECESHSRKIVISAGDRKKWLEMELAMSGDGPDEALVIRSERVEIPLLVRKAGLLQVPEKSGLNWGQREGREPNQAYLSLPSVIRNFFPPPPTRFMVYTKRFGGFVAVRAQAQGKALQSSTNNSTLGLILRAAIDAPPGSFVTTEAIQNAGLASLSCYRLISGDFYLEI